MSVRTTGEISADHYALADDRCTGSKFRIAWVDSDFATYFWNSTDRGRRRGRDGHLDRRGGRPLPRALPLPRQPADLLHPVLLDHLSAADHADLDLPDPGDYNLYNSLLGLTLVYISLQLPLTVYLLEGFFARIPQDLFDAAKMDGYWRLEIFWRIVLPVGMPAIATTLILNFIQLWNEFLFAVVLITDPDKRTLPIGIRAFMGDHFQDIGMIATGIMISVLPVIVVYVFFSEKLIRGMTAGAIK